MTALWTASAIIDATQARTLCPQDWNASGVSIDSRTVQSGDLFIALQGPTHDGHDHVAAALRAGAAGALVAHQPKDVAADAPLIFVQDTFKGLQDLGRAGRARSQAAIIAVTGSVGKTGTKEMLRLLLGAVGSVYANEGSLNNHWGVPLSLARLPAEARFGVFEMGMNHAGELTDLAAQVRPHVALITTIEAVHSEHFASVEAITDAKAEIFLGMEPTGVAVLNRDNSAFARLAHAAQTRGLQKILGFGRDAQAEARLLECTPLPEGGSAIVADILGQTIRYRLGASGEHLALNSVGALLAAISAGGDRDVCAAALTQFHPPKGRGVVRK